MKLQFTLAVALAAMATSAAAAPPPAPSPGQTLFEQRCTVCHSVQPTPGKMGPPLAGVAGRKAGTAPGYAYSTALKASNITWTPDALDTFLKGPGKMVPGTKMLVGAPDAAQRATLVQYLGSLKK
jgi:cytochrome c